MYERGKGVPAYMVVGRESGARDYGNWKFYAVEGCSVDAYAIIHGAAARFSLRK